MSDPAIIQGTFSSMKHVPSRNVMQLIIEVAIEQADHALNALGGLPLPGAAKFVAIALLDHKVIQSQKPAKTEKSKIGLNEMEKARIRAVMLCDDVAFIKWIGAIDAVDAADKMRLAIKAKSRSLIGKERDVFSSFLAFETKFKQETGRMAEAR